MKWIYAKDQEKLIPARSLKNITHPNHPGYKFFAHRAYKEDGYTVSEETTGARIISAYSHLQNAITAAENRLSEVTADQMRKAVNEEYDRQINK
jgi:lactam utilization protein B